MSELEALDRDWSRRVGIHPSPELHVQHAGSTTIRVPPEADYFIWRFPFTDRMSSAPMPADLDRDWSYPDMLIAHGMLDAIDDAVARENEANRQRSKT